MASLRNFSVAACQADGWKNIAAALRWAGRSYRSPVSILKIAT